MTPTIRFTFLGFNLGALLDAGKTLDVEETQDRISDGSLFRWLKEEFGDDIDLSPYEPADQAAVLKSFEGTSASADPRRKFGVEHNGLVLLVALCFNAIQLMAIEKR